MGISSGIFVHTIFAVFGLAAIIATSAWAFTTIKFAGATYLIYLGIQAWLRKSKPLSTPEINSMKFEWDERKNQSNLAKHGFDFTDAFRIFNI